MSEVRSWYQEPWVLGVIAIPFTAVLFGFVMLYSAGVYRDDLVVDDYYKDGMAINKEIAEQQVALRGGMQAAFDFDGEFLSVTTAGMDDSALTLSLHHVTSQALDRKFVLAGDGGGRYLLSDVGLSEVLGTPGVWYVELRGAEGDWKISARITPPLTGWTMGSGSAGR